MCTGAPTVKLGGRTIGLNNTEVCRNLTELDQALKHQERRSTEGDPEKRRNSLLKTVKAYKSFKKFC